MLLPALLMLKASSDPILSSRDMEGVPAHSETAMGAVEKVLSSIPNTMSLLSNS